MEAIELRKLVLAFLEIAVESIRIENAKGEGFYDINEVLDMWIKLPDCQLTPMFLGYALALGHDINSFNLTDLELAVQTALVGDDGVDFDWLGGCDATDKPH